MNPAPDNVMRTWFRRSGLGVTVLGTLLGAWYATAVFVGEGLRQATVEAKALCDALAGEHECPAKLTFSLESSGDVARDPWGRPYLCRVDGQAVVVSSYGADGAPLGAGRAGDVECRSAAAEISSRCGCVVKTTEQ